MEKKNIDMIKIDYRNRFLYIDIVNEALHFIIPTSLFCYSVEILIFFR